MTSTNADERRLAERALFFAYAELRQAEDDFDGSDASRQRLRAAQAALETAEIVALAVLNFGTSEESFA